MPKSCTKCKEVKPIASFSKGSGRGGIRSICKTCSSEITKSWRKKNPERVRELKRNWQKNNLWQANEAFARRKAMKINATPSWGQDKQVVSPYKLAKFLEGMLHTKYEVDHIVPLVSPIVCGLHVNDNLQVLRQSVNKLKSNRWDIQ